MLDFSKPDLIWLERHWAIAYDLVVVVIVDVIIQFTTGNSYVCERLLGSAAALTYVPQHALYHAKIYDGIMADHRIPYEAVNMAKP